MLIWAVASDYTTFGYYVAQLEDLEGTIGRPWRGPGWHIMDAQARHLGAIHVGSDL